jgi:hypothetical protein
VTRSVTAFFFEILLGGKRGSLLLGGGRGTRPVHAFDHKS